MICRIWHGCTSFDNADAYEKLLQSEIFINIDSRKIKGYNGIHLLRRNLQNEVEFITIMWFDSLDAVKTFAGEQYEEAVVPEKARVLLSHFDKLSQHYELQSTVQPAFRLHTQPTVRLLPCQTPYSR
jgi:heme-degrading monooxygenase HmoA